MAKILFITSFQSVPRTVRMAKVLNKIGHTVHILEWDRSGKLPETEVKEGVYFIRYKKASEYGFKSLHKFLGWIIFQITYLINNGYEVVQPQNLDSLIPVLIACYIRKIFKKPKVKIVYDMADFYADAYLNVPIIRNFIAVLERKMINKVDALILVSPKQLLQLKRSNLKKIEIVYNSPESSSTEYIEISNLHKRLNLVYIGVFNRYRVKYLKKMFEIFKKIPVELVIGGFGELEEEVIELSKRYWNFVKFVGKVDDSKIKDLLLRADLVISYFDPRDTFNHVVALPNKFLYALSVGRPVIVAKGTYLAELCEKYNIGISTDIFDEPSINSLISILNELLNNKRMLNEMGRRALALFNEIFSWEKNMEKYISLYNEILKR